MMSGPSSGSGIGLCGNRAPPPTPSQGHGSIVNNDAFSAFLETSLRFSGLALPDTPAKTTSMEVDVPVLDFAGDAEDVVRRVAESASEFGFFQIVNHGLDEGFVAKAEAELHKLFDERSDEEDEETILLNYKDSKPAEDLLPGVASSELRNYGENMEKLACDITRYLLKGLGSWDFETFSENVEKDNASLICLCNQKGISKVSLEPRLKRTYPHILSLQYQDKARSYEIYVDRSWAKISTQAGCILVTVGDIMKVWSNGQYKSVVGRAVAEDACRLMELLYSPSAESTISPIPQDSDSTIPAYSSFLFKDYASRLMKQRLLFKDPLDRFRLYV